MPRRKTFRFDELQAKSYIYKVQIQIMAFLFALLHKIDETFAFEIKNSNEKFFSHSIKIKLLKYNFINDNKSILKHLVFVYRK